MVEGEGRPGSGQAVSDWVLAYELSFDADQEPQIECTVHADGTGVRALGLRFRDPLGEPRIQDFDEDEITTVASDVGTLLTVQLERGAAGGSIEHMMVVLPTVPIVSDPDDRDFDHFAAAAIIQKQAGAGELAEPPDQSWRILQWEPGEDTGSKLLKRRRRGV